MSLQHMILGVLKYEPLSGYDLKKAFQVSVQHFWETDQSQIYRALYKMHEQGWIAVETVEQAGAPAKKLYRLTDAGWAELRRWLATPEPIPSLHEGWLGQLFFAAESTPDQTRQILEARVRELQAILDHYINEVPASAAEYAERFNAYAEVDNWLLTLNYGIEKARFDLQWAEHALAALPPDESSP